MAVSFCSIQAQWLAMSLFLLTECYIAPILKTDNKGCNTTFSKTHAALEK
jgi:hypothetical protein